MVVGGVTHVTGVFPVDKVHFVRVFVVSYLKKGVGIRGWVARLRRVFGDWEEM